MEMAGGGVATARELGASAAAAVDAGGAGAGAAVGGGGETKAGVGEMGGNLPSSETTAGGLRGVMVGCGRCG
jgi:hypothetical protein